MWAPVYGYSIVISALKSIDTLWYSYVSMSRGKLGSGWSDNVRDAAVRSMSAPPSKAFHLAVLAHAERLCY